MQLTRNLPERDDRLVEDNLEAFIKGYRQAWRSPITLDDREWRGKDYFECIRHLLGQDELPEIFRFTENTFGPRYEWLHRCYQWLNYLTWLETSEIRFVKPEILIDTVYLRGQIEEYIRVKMIRQ